MTDLWLSDAVCTMWACVLVLCRFVCAFCINLVFIYSYRTSITAQGYITHVGMAGGFTAVFVQLKLIMDYYVVYSMHLRGFCLMDSSCMQYKEA